MKKSSVFFVLMAGILWGLMGLYVRQLNAMGLYTMDVVMVRTIFTTVILFLFLLFSDRKSFKIKLRDVWIFAGSGLLSIIFFNYCYFTTISNASLAVAAVLLYTAPAIVMVLSAIIFKERITKRKMMAILLTFIGCVLVSGIINGDSSISFKVFLIGLGAGLGYALYSIFSRFALNRGYGSLTITFYTFLFAAIISPLFGHIGSTIEILTLKPGRLLFAMLYAFACTILPYLFYTYGLKGISNGNASVIASIEPITATALGFFYNETPNILTILGILMVLLGIIICRKE